MQNNISIGLSRNRPYEIDKSLSKLTINKLKSITLNAVKGRSIKCVPSAMFYSFSNMYISKQPIANGTPYV